MKKLVLAFSFVIGGLAVYAQDTTKTTSPTQQYPTTNSSSSSSTSMGQDDQDREKINSRDLPDAVKRSLEGTEYRGWLVNAAYKSKGVGMNQDGTTSSDSTSTSSSSSTSSTGSNSSSTSTSSTGSDSTSVGTPGQYAQEVYVVELKNGAQTKTVRFDKDGNKLDDQGEQK